MDPDLTIEDIEYILFRLHELTIAELEYILFGREIPTPMDID
jgi:hypothetical protein